MHLTSKAVLFTSLYFKLLILSYRLSRVHVYRTYRRHDMTMHPEYAEYLVEQLYKIGSIQFGDFTLKSGLNSPVYFDMRLLVSHPDLLVSFKSKILTVCHCNCDYRNTQATLCTI